MYRIILIFIFLFLIINLILNNELFIKKNRNLNLNLNNDHLVIIKSIFYDTIKNESDSKVSNGFFYFFNNQTYLITTTHTIFYNWHDTSNPKIANKILVTGKNIDKFEIKDYYYSRYFDVFIAKVSNKYKSINLINDKFNQKEININYIDINNNNLINITSEYIENIYSNINLFGIRNVFLDGSSGSCVFDKNNHLIGMISTLDLDYKDKTLAIPIKTINNLINIYSKQFKYLGFESNYIDHSILGLIPYNTKKLLNSDNGYYGEFVENSIIDQIKPFDIITKINNQTVDDKNKLINLLLNDQNQKKLKVEFLKINDKFRNDFLSYPRELFLRKPFLLDKNSYYYGDNNYIYSKYRTKMTINIKEIEQLTNLNYFILDDKTNSKYVEYLKKGVKIQIEYKKSKYGSKGIYLIKYLLIKNFDKDNKKIFFEPSINNVKNYFRNFFFIILPSICYSEDNSFYFKPRITNLETGKEIISRVSKFYGTTPFIIRNNFDEGEKKILLNEKQYKMLIFLQISKFWSNLIISFVKTKSFAQQINILDKETIKLMVYLKEINKKLKFDNLEYSKMITFIFTSFYVIATEYLSLNCGNVINYFLIILLQKNIDYFENILYFISQFTDSLITKISELNFKINIIDKLKSTEDLNERKNIVNRIYVQNSFIKSDFQDAVLERNSEISKQVLIKNENSNDLNAKELNYIYIEFNRLINMDLSDQNKLFNIKNYANLKYFWKSSDLSLNIILQDDNFKYKKKEIDLNLIDLPKIIDLFPYINTLTQNKNSNSNWFL